MAITQDPLFQGMTRPTMVFGVTYEALLVCVMVTAVVFLGSGNPLYLLVFAPLYGVVRLICASEPRFFELLKVWSITKGRCLNRGYWGSSSYSPTEPVRHKPTPKEQAEIRKQKEQRIKAERKKGKTK